MLFWLEFVLSSLEPVACSLPILRIKKEDTYPTGTLYIFQSIANYFSFIWLALC